MNCVLWSMGDASFHGMGASSGARQCGVTHVPRLKRYLCLRTVPADRYQEVPAVSTGATGEFRAEISRDGSAIDWELSFSGLQAPVTQAHIHVGQRSVIGGIVIWLCQTATNPAPASVTALTQTCPQSGTITGTAAAANVVATAANQQIAA